MKMMCSSISQFGAADGLLVSCRVNLTSVMGFILLGPDLTPKVQNTSVTNRFFGIAVVQGLRRNRSPILYGMMPVIIFIWEKKRKKH